MGEGWFILWLSEPHKLVLILANIWKPQGFLLLPFFVSGVALTVHSLFTWAWTCVTVWKYTVLSCFFILIKCLLHLSPSSQDLTICCASCSWRTHHIGNLQGFGKKRTHPHTHTHKTFIHLFLLWHASRHTEKLTLSCCDQRNKTDQDAKESTAGLACTGRPAACLVRCGTEERGAVCAEEN